VRGGDAPAYSRSGTQRPQRLSGGAASRAKLVTWSPSRPHHILSPGEKSGVDRHPATGCSHEGRLDSALVAKFLQMRCPAPSHACSSLSTGRVSSIPAPSFVRFSSVLWVFSPASYELCAVRGPPGSCVRTTCIQVSPPPVPPESDISGIRLPSRKNTYYVCRMRPRVGDSSRPAGDFGPFLLPRSSSFLQHPRRTMWGETRIFSYGHPSIPS